MPLPCLRSSSCRSSNLKPTSYLWRWRCSVAFCISAHTCNQTLRGSVECRICRTVVFELVLVAVVDSGLIARARFQLKFLSANLPVVRVVRGCTILLWFLRLGTTVKYCSHIVVTFLVRSATTLKFSSYCMVKFLFWFLKFTTTHKYFSNCMVKCLLWFLGLVTTKSISHIEW